MRFVKFLIAASGILVIAGIAEIYFFEDHSAGLVALSLGWLTLLHALNLYDRRI